MRLLHVLHSHGYGGAENHALTLMRAQRDAGHDVLYAGPRDSWLADHCKRNGLAHEHLSMAGLFDVVSVLKLRSLARQWQAQIVHGHLVRGAHYAGWAAWKQPGVLAVCTAHATTARKHMGRCARIIAVSKAVADGLYRNGYRPDRVRVVYNGVADQAGDERGAVRRELGIPDNVCALVNVGRFIEDKGQDVLVSALSACPAHVRLYLIGDWDTPFGRAVRAQAAGDARICFIGYRADVQRLLTGFDVYVAASRREALGLSLVEAAAARLPTLATSVGGIPEVVVDGETGWLVPDGADQVMASRIVQLAGDPVQRERMGRRARAHYESRFTVEAMLAETQAVYQEALGA